MRDYVSPAELNAYADLCVSVADADAATGAKTAGHSKLPPAPRRVTLGLNDLAAAEAARQEQQDACDLRGMQEIQFSGGLQEEVWLGEINGAVRWEGGVCVMKISGYPQEGGNSVCVCTAAFAVSCDLW